MILAFVLVAVDVGHLSDYQSWARIGPTLIAAVALGIGTGWDRRSLGFALTPKQGWQYWFHMTVKLGLVLLVLLVPYVLIRTHLGYPLPIYPMDDRDFVRRWLFRSCIFFPLVEEGIYRFTLCTPTVAHFGFWPTVVISGLAFGCLHVGYGNVSPDNLLGGFMLAWTYLKSESIILPVVLHSLGNLCIVLANVVYFNMSSI